MSALPLEVIEAWENREGPVVLTTVAQQGIPNSIYATCVNRFNEEILVVADNYFDKTRANILAGCKASLLFITKDGKSYQIKGQIELVTEGAIYDDMKRWNPAKHPGHAAAALHVEQAFSGSNRLL